MKNQEIFKTKYIEKLVQKLYNFDFSSYSSKTSDYSREDIIVNEHLQILELANLSSSNFFGNKEFENAKALFEMYKTLTPEQASDPRFWTYLSHVTFRQYMRKKRLPETRLLPNKTDKLNVAKFILQHWFVYPLNAKNLLRNDISFMWWGVYLTYDLDRKDPYELTKELFSMQDYTRHFQGSLSRNKVFIHAILEFVLKNKELFSRFKEGKIRLLMRRANQIAGYRCFSGLSKEEVVSLFSELKDELDSVKGKEKNEGIVETI